MELGAMYRKGRNKYLLVVDVIPTIDHPPPPPNPPWDYFPNQNILDDSCHIFKVLDVGTTSIYNGFCRKDGSLTIYAEPHTIYHREDKKTIYKVG